MNHAAARPASPGSNAVRELLLAITEALTLPKPVTTADETTYLRLQRDHARLVLFACRRVVADHGIDDHDLMVAADSLRNYAADFPDETYEHAAELTP
jgi:hypothetical protein